MTQLMFYLFVFYSGYLKFCQGSSPKFNIDDETVLISPSPVKFGDNVEVKHTIVISSQLKNNNEEVRYRYNDETPDITISVDKNGRPIKADRFKPDVPEIKGWKAVETTRLKPPDDQRYHRPSSVVVNKNIYEHPRNNGMNQWKPSNFFNNINWSPYDPSKNLVEIKRKHNEESMKDFYCKRCQEMMQEDMIMPCALGRTLAVMTPSMETTTRNIKIDGKLAKLD